MAEIDIILPEREDIAADVRNAWLARSTQANPDRPADVGEGTLPHHVGEVVADIALPFYANHDKIARSFVVSGMTGDRLERYAKERLPLNSDGTVRIPASGGAGYMEATKIVAGGAFIDVGTTLTHQPTGTRIQVLVANTYADGDPIPIQALDVGPATNLDADEQLVWDSPPAGVSQTATILQQNDGTGTLVGLIGGRDVEIDEELQDRVIEAQSNPAAAGNSSEIVQAAQRTGGVPVQKAFIIPAWFGPGSACVAFTLRPDVLASRIPNSTQRGLVAAALAAFPTDYSLTIASVLAQPVSVALGVSWASGARTWADLTTWPEHIPGDPVVVDGAVTIASNGFRVTTATTTDAPQVGQTIALFDLTNKTFKKKRIATVTEIVAGKSWDLTFATANAASDTFTPADGALVCPYSQSLVRLVAPVLAYMQTLGPGEQFASLPDPGGRRRRWPFSPESWPSVLSNEGLVGAAKASGAVADTEVLAPSVPYSTTVGTPGVSVYLLQLGDFAVFPQT